MREYYHISQLTGRGYETLLDAVDGTMVCCFYNGTIIALGINPVMDDIKALSECDTLEAA